MIITAYAISDTNQFWDDLKASKGLREVKSQEPSTYQSRSKGTVTTQFFEIAADSLDDKQLMGVFIFARPDLTYALTLTVPKTWPQNLRLEAAWMLGQIAGMGEKMDKTGDVPTPELAKPRPYSEAGLFVQLETMGLAARPSAVGSAQSSSLMTRAQWKNRLANSFGWLPGAPVTAQASRFQQVMGKPDDTQTLGDQTLWYYRCADGTIQLAMSALNLQTAGYMQAEVNDY